jgi:hypothetical protein
MVIAGMYLFFETLIIVRSYSEDYETAGNIYWQVNWFYLGWIVFTVLISVLSIIAIISINKYLK